MKPIILLIPLTLGILLMPACDKTPATLQPDDRVKSNAPNEQSQDAKWEQALIGTWRYLDTAAPNVVIDFETTYLSGGKANANGTFKSGDNVERITAQISWHVTNGHLSATIESTNRTDILTVGQKLADRIVSITDKEFTYVDGKSGQTIVEGRVKR